MPLIGAAAIISVLAILGLLWCRPYTGSRLIEFPTSREAPRPGGFNDRDSQRLHRPRKENGPTE